MNNLVRSGLHWGYCTSSRSG